MHGFNIYKGLEDLEFVEQSPIEVSKKEAPSKTDRILDLIFARDKNGWPSSSIAVMLSEKTSDDVRKFIQDNLFSLTPDSHAITDDKVVAEFSNLKSDFIAMASRNRFESIEDYESRLQGIMEEFQKNETKQDVIKMMREHILKK